MKIGTHHRVYRAVKTDTQIKKEQKKTDTVEDRQRRKVKA
jgi:hypothetical protein